MNRLAKRLRDPYSFPLWYWRSARIVARPIRRQLRHPTRDAFRGINTSGSIMHGVWWWFTDVGWSQAWRPLCWVRGYHVPHHCDVYFEKCVVCATLLWSRKRDGSPNPFIRPVVDRVPVGRRR